MIHVVLAADENYMKHLLTTANSIVQNTKESVHFHILSDVEPEELFWVIRDKDDVTWYDTEELPVEKLPISIDYISVATYYRLFLTKLLDNDIDKVIYLDVDLIVRKDLSLLWNEDISNYYAGAVTDELDLLQTKRLGLPRYFNAGVLLLNLKMMREHNIHKEFFAILEFRAEELPMQDQDVLNLAFKNQWKELDLTYNPGSVVFFPDVYAHSSVPLYQVRKASHDPSIVHFTGPDKPWKFSCCHPYKNDYVKYSYEFSQKFLFALSLLFKYDKSFKEQAIRLFGIKVFSLYGNTHKQLRLFNCTIWRF